MQKDYSEVVDSIADVLEAAIIVENALQDGFQFQDVLQVLQVQPRVQEVINDAPVFVDQFLSLTPITAVQAVQEAKTRVVKSQPGKVVGFVLRILTQVASSYSFAASSYVNAQAQILAWQQLFNNAQTPQA